MNKVCKNCGVNFRGRKSSMFCSLKCYSEFKRKQNEKTCTYCGKIFSTSPSRKKFKNIFCSALCYGKFNSGKNNYQWRERQTLKCLTCGKEFEVRLAPSQIDRKKFCSKTCLTLHTIKYNNPKMDTLPERIVKEFLISQNIPFEQQIIIKNIGVVDFLINGILVVECDGDYWHSLPINKLRDWRKGFLLRLNGYPLLRFWEHEIKKGGSWKEKILDVWKSIKISRLVI